MVAEFVAVAPPPGTASNTTASATYLHCLAPAVRQQCDEAAATVMLPVLTTRVLHWFQFILFLDVVQRMFPLCFVCVCVVPCLCCCVPMTLLSCLVCVGILRARDRQRRQTEVERVAETVPFKRDMCEDEDHSVCAICLVDFQVRV